MNLSGITSTDPTRIGALRPLTAGVGSPASVDADGDHDGSRGGPSVSPLASLFGQLAQLQQSDPAKLKAVLGDIAGELQAAGQQDGGSQGQALATLADKFKQAAQTGDLSSLKPAHHHHRGHHQGAAAYQQASDAGRSASSATDGRSQVLDIINKVISDDLGGSASTA